MRTIYLLAITGTIFICWMSCFGNNLIASVCNPSRTLLINIIGLSKNLYIVCLLYML